VLSTGAARRKQGKFELAGDGTIFLGEIGEMSAAHQAKLLHVLQDGTFSRLGGNEELSAKARVVTATHRKLEEMVASGEFREDLYFRLNVVSVRIPPLRERRDELDKLVETFGKRYSARYGRPEPQLSKQLMSVFDRHPFPGNIRELENMMKRIVILESEEGVLRELLDQGGRGTGEQGSELEAVLAELEETAGEIPLKEVGRRAAVAAEREAVSRTLFQTDWNRKQAAELLHVSYKALLSKIRECEIEPL
jgi:two-component system response regulator AtoC